MVMSRDPGFKFRKFLFLCLILYKILGKVTKFGENLLKNKKVTGKKKLGVEKTSQCLKGKQLHYHSPNFNL